MLIYSELIYSDSTSQFISDIRENKLTEIMTANFANRYGHNPNYREVQSWQNSLPHVRNIIEIAELMDNKIVLEYEVPYNQSSRIDCLLFGKGDNEVANIVLIELKQWSSVKALEDAGNFVETYVGVADKIVAHPSEQAKGYNDYLKNFVSEFDTPPPLLLFSCAYCHNYKKSHDDGLYDPIYKPLIDEFPIYSKEDTRILADKIKRLLDKGDGFEIFNRFMRSPIRPSKKLLDNVAKIIKNEAVFSLLNEQLVAKNLIWSKVRKAGKAKEKSVIIIHGGPGTGKSVIAVNILAEAAQKGKKVFYGCKSKPFIEGLKKLVGGDGRILFSNLYRFLPSRVKENELDLVLIDEAHRVGKNSNFQYTREEDRTDMPQIDQLIRCAKTSVFFIDDKQNVRYQEVGSSDLIRHAAASFGCKIYETDLLTQYRCMGSNDYLLWLESVLGYSEGKRILRKNEVFEFKIFDSPSAMYQQLLEKELDKKNSARIVAGFCWQWSSSLDHNGELVKDVVIDDFAMPWETHEKIGRPPRGYVKWYEWAYKPEGIKQVGCIYTAQGFEFDYIGVIIGKDLIYDSKQDKLIADISKTADPTLRRSRDNFETYVKNIYRTLLSRGMKGCYVYFVDAGTRNYFEKYMEATTASEKITSAVTSLSEEAKDTVVLPFRRLPLEEIRPFENCVPLYDFKVAAGTFSDEQQVEDRSDINWVELSDTFRHRKDLFVAQVVGESMNRRIPNGSWCLFRLNPTGTRQGKVVLAQHRGIADVDNGGEFTVKKYESKKTRLPDGTWRHTSIILRPDTTVPGYEPLTFTEEQVDNVNVIAELIAVLG